MRLYERGLLLATEQGAPVLRGAADMHVGMSGLFIEWDDLDAATHHLLTSNELGDHAGLALNPSRWHAGMARIREIEGDLDGALELLEEAERLYVSEFYPDVRPGTADRFTFQLKVQWRSPTGALSTVVVNKYTDDTAGAWQPVATTLVAQSGASLARVQIVTGSLNATIYVDDMTLTMP